MTSTPNLARFTRGEFRRIFAAKYVLLLRALVDPALKKSDLTDPDTVERVVAGFRELTPDPAPGAAKFPKHIWMLWQQGWHDLPPIVEVCVRSWRDRNPDWQLHLLDERSLPDHASAYTRFDVPDATRQARANLARTCLLAEHGGVWADATLFCARALDEWLPAMAGAGIFMFSNPRPYRAIDNWFIASQANGRAITAMQEMFFEYWRLFRRPHHYFWMHYLIEHLVSRDAEIGSLWRQMPRVSALGAFVVMANAFDRRAPQPVFDAIAGRILPVHKLKRKWRGLGDIAGTPLAALTGLDRL